MSAWVEPAGKRWRVRARMRGVVTTVQGRIATQPEAEQVAATYRRLVEQGLLTDPRGLTLASWGATWLDRRELDGVAGIRQERSAWARHVADSALAKRPVDAIASPHVVAWLDEVRRAKKLRTIRRRTGVELVETDEEISAQTARHALRLVSGALDDAVLRGVIASNPAAAVSLPAQRTTSRSSTDPDEDEVWTFLTADEIARLDRVDPRRREFFTLAIFTGLRLGELLALRWADVDLARDRVRVRRSKNGRSRTVPLLGPARAALESLWALRTSAQQASPLVICRTDGDAYAEGYTGRWSETWRRYLTDRPVRFHDLRHTCASHLVLGTWGRALRLDEAKAWLGHASITVTQRYAHLGEGHLDELARSMSAPVTLLQRAPKAFTDLSAPPGGFEPPTVGLEGRVASEQFRALSADLERLRSKAREYLASVGQPHERHAAITLAEAVLDATEETPCEARPEEAKG